MKNIFIKAVAFMLMFTGFTSCLEDDKAPLDPSGVQNVVEFLPPSQAVSPAGSIYPAYANSFLLADEATFNATISWSGPQDDNGSDIIVKLAVDEDALNLYNTDQSQGLAGKDALGGTTYELMPDENYDIETLEYTIPRGQKTVVVPIKLYLREFEFGHNYAVPLKIVSTSSSAISAHYNTAILGLGVRNKYDGIYRIVSGSMYRYGSGPDYTNGVDLLRSGDYRDHYQMELKTLSSNSVSIEPLFANGGGIAGIDGTFITIDEATNEVTMASSNPALANTPAKENKFIPGTPQEFLLNFQWSGGNRIINDLLLEYVGPRP